MNYKLVLFAGQSNIVGFNNYDSGGYVITPRVQIWTDVNMNGTFDVADNFNMMVPGLNTGTPNNPTVVGPEVAFANKWLLDNPTGTLFIAKVGKGSTSLQEQNDLDWSPNSDNELFDYAKMVANHVQANLGVKQLDAVFWMQGEDDALSQSAAAEYQDNLVEFLGAVRNEWMNDADGYIGYGRITDNPVMPYNLDVRAAQWYVDQIDPYSESFKTIGFGMQADGIHYNTQGYVQLGEAFYTNWIM